MQEARRARGWRRAERGERGAPRAGASARLQFAGPRPRKLLAACEYAGRLDIDTFMTHVSIYRFTRTGVSSASCSQAPAKHRERGLRSLAGVAAGPGPR